MFNTQRSLGIKTRLIRLRELNLYMFIDFQTAGISSTLYCTRKREEDMIQLIKNNLPGFGDIIDCGSNIGFYPILASQLTKENQKIVCIEPDPRNYRILELNKQFISKNSIFLNCSVSDKCKTSILEISDASNLNKIIREGNSQVDKFITTQCYTIDDIVRTYGLKPTFLRMDIEGHEVEVLRGMKHTLKNAEGKLIVFFELHPGQYSKSHSLESELLWMFENGYKTKYIVSAGEEQPAAFKSLGLYPDYTVSSDGFQRGVYSVIPNDAAILLATHVPKIARYIMLENHF